MNSSNPTPPAAGQESVWDYPRPPRLEQIKKRIQVVFNGVTIAESMQAWRVLETSHPPVYYISPQDIKMNCLQPAGGSSFCEWKGQAAYYDVVVGSKTANRCAWTYPKPQKDFLAIQDHIAFYAGMMDGCYVNGEKVIPQPGGFYGGWITEEIVGPFKGVPGSWGW